MGFSTPTHSKLATIHRMMIQGPPNSGKTSSVCRTWPRPLAILSSPGEKGDATIPRGVDGITSFIWEDDPVSKTSSRMVIDQVETLTWEILGGKHGQFKSFCFDGYHKFYDYWLDWISGGALFGGKEIGEGGDQWTPSRLYNRTRQAARYFTQRVNMSPIENIVWTCWDGKESDEPGKKGAQSHIFPNLPGQAAKEFMGEFGLVVHSRIKWGERQPQGRAPAKWQLKPEGEVWGASVKVPIEVWDKLPIYIDQSYTALQETLEKAWQLSQTKEAK